MPDDVTEANFICFFCGLSVKKTEVTLGAFWEDEASGGEQYWAAHRECLIDQMSPEVRAFGGPLTDD